MNEAARRNGSWLFAFIGLLALAWIGLEVSERYSSPATRLNRAWARDVELLRKSERWPIALNKLKSIELRGGDSAAHHLLRQSLRPPLKANPKGIYSLRILITTWRSGADWGIILQYELLDRTSNKIWEIGRTLQLHGRPPLEIVPARN